MLKLNVKKEINGLTVKNLQRGKYERETRKLKGELKGRGVGVGYFSRFVIR